MDSPSAPRQNRLLAALSASEFERISPHLKLVHLELGQILHEPGQKSTHLYFPVNSIISLVSVLQDGHTGEMAVAGREGVVGVSVFMGGRGTPSEAIVEIAGDAYRLPGKVTEEEFFRARDFGRIMLLYTHALLTQIGQTAICNRHHTIEQQLCRWLLMLLDRLRSNEVRMTQELIAQMLGVRREGVTMVARKLREEGVISYTRGRITIVDRAALEAHCCECYRVVKTEYDRLEKDLSQLRVP